VALAEREAAASSGRERQRQRAAAEREREAAAERGSGKGTVRQRQRGREGWQASGASGHRLFALQLQRGCRCAAQLGYVRLVLHARRGVVNPASLVCGRARGDE
jgi:hypothetical protein